MRGDFSDVRFDPTKHFSRVLMQQGRVQLDSDQNEQADIVLHYLRALAADLIGPHGGPGDGFEIIAGAGNPPDAFAITPGRYYVNGILCELEAEAPVAWNEQPDYRLDESATLPDLPFLVFLDVWERFVSSAEDDSIREVALGGPDTAGRSRVVWQTRTFALEGSPDCAGAWVQFEAAFTPSASTLSARTAQDDRPDDPCLVPADSAYRGEENQLYRVEIHRGGAGWDGTSEPNGSASFKWSRDNGSNVFPVRSFTGSEVTVEYLGHDRRTDLVEGDLVEVQYEDWVLGDRKPPGSSPPESPPPLVEVESVDRESFVVTLGGDLGEVTDDMRSSATLLRRWDRVPGWTANQAGFSADGATLVRGGADPWIDLENGIQVAFAGGSEPFRTGDYWLVPARVATGDVRWPETAAGPAPRPPAGVEHRYVPLAIITAAGITDCRRVIKPSVVGP